MLLRNGELLEVRAVSCQGKEGVEAQLPPPPSILHINRLSAEKKKTALTGFSQEPGAVTGFARRSHTYLHFIASVDEHKHMTTGLQI